MKRTRPIARCFRIAACGAVILSLLTSYAKDPPNPGNRVNNLISDVGGLAKRTDGRIVNPWGLAVDTSRFYVAENGTGLITTHNLDGAANRSSIVVPLPPDSTNTHATPTGLVLNRNNGFLLTNTTFRTNFSGRGTNITTNVTTLTKRAKATILFATEDGTIGGWNSTFGSNATIAVTTPGAVYKSLALGTSSNGPTLFAANFRAGVVEAYDTNFTLINTFGADPALGSGFAPFGMKVINKKLFVTFVRVDPADPNNELPGVGNGGLVRIFNLNGGPAVRTFAFDDGALDAPWGLALAPTHFGQASGNLLVGNFGNGVINIYNIMTGEFLGTLNDSTGVPLAIPGLWALDFGREPAEGHSDFEATSLFFTAGIDNEANGVIGTIRAISPFVTPMR